MGREASAPGGDRRVPVLPSSRPVWSSGCRA